MISPGKFISHVADLFSSSIVEVPTLIAKQASNALQNLMMIMLCFSVYGNATQNFDTFIL